MTLSQLVKRSLEIHKAKIALLTLDGVSLTYNDLAVLVSHYSKEFKDKFPPQSRIGVVVEKSPEAVAILLALLMSDMVYVPIDPQSSVNRMVNIVTDCDLAGIVSYTSLLDSMVSQLGIPATDISKFHNDFDLLVLHEDQIGYPVVGLDTADLAIILYTSGSTGYPKGVMLTSDNIHSFVKWSTSAFSIDSGDCLSSLAMLHFDLSVLDILSSISNGASVVLFDSKDAKNPMLISSSIQKFGITICYATPSLYRLIYEYGKLERYDCNSLRTVLFAGEIYPPHELSMLMGKWSNADFYNLYGPTETNVVTYYKVPRNQPLSDAIPIGRACAHVRCVLNEHTKEVINGTVHGELLVSGASVTPGYWNNQRQNDAAFIVDSNGVVWYRTGDWVSVTEDGDYVFQGRKDRMLKKNGYRVELDEIERNLRLIDEVLDVALVSCSKDQRLVLVAYIVKSQSQVVSAMTIKQSLRNYLPQYMIPDVIRFLDEVPKTSTHKTDYQKLMHYEI